MPPVKYILDVPVAVSTDILVGGDRALDVNHDGWVSRAEVFSAAPTRRMTPAQLAATRRDAWASISGYGEDVERRGVEDRASLYFGNGHIAGSLGRLAATLLVAEPAARQSMRTARGGFTMRAAIRPTAMVAAGAITGAGVSIARSVLVNALSGTSNTSRFAITNTIGTAVYEGAAWGTSAIVGGIVGAGASTFLGPVAGGIVGMVVAVAFKHYVLDSARNAVVNYAVTH